MARDEFRVHVHAAPGGVRGLVAALKDLEEEEKGRPPGAPDPIAVSHDGDDVFLYASSPDAAQRALSAAREALTRAGTRGSVTSERWHPLEERWEDAARPLPANEQERQTELDRVRKLERAEYASTGWAHWEVRVVAPSLHTAVTLAGQLRGEGLPVIRRWRYVFVGAPSEADAAQLAQRLRGEAPEGSQLSVEANQSAVAHSVRSNLFAFFGGLGG